MSMRVILMVERIYVIVVDFSDYIVFVCRTMRFVCVFVHALCLRVCVCVCECGSIDARAFVFCFLARLYNNVVVHY